MSKKRVNFLANPILDFKSRRRRMRKIIKLTGILLVISLLSLTFVGCKGAPRLSLQVTSPQARAEVTEGVITVSGIVSDASATVTVNGVTAQVTQDGAFSHEIELPYGKTTVTVTATVDKQRVSRSVTVTRILTIDITSPEDKADIADNQITVSGVVSNPAARVTVNNIEVQVAEDGAFSSIVELDYVQNTINITATVDGVEPVTKTLTVTRILALEITSPKPGAEITESPVTVTGIVSNPKATVKVNGVVAEVAEDGTFSVEVEIAEGQNTIVVTAVEPITKTVTVTYVSGEGRITEEQSRKLAEQFVRNSPTFLFDGMEETLKLVETLYPDIEESWAFIFHFESKHAGYGDRTGQVLAQVITPHEAVIAVEQGEIKSAIMDEKWDMLTQKMVASP